MSKDKIIELGKLKDIEIGKPFKINIPENRKIKKIFEDEEKIYLEFEEAKVKEHEKILIPLTLWDDNNNEHDFEIEYINQEILSCHIVDNFYNRTIDFFEFIKERPKILKTYRRIISYYLLRENKKEYANLYNVAIDKLILNKKVEKIIKQFYSTKEDFLKELELEKEYVKEYNKIHHTFLLSTK